ncbi:MAG: efflux RND transporter periplasmic adaptor subunit [Candidatus Omnitrophica bacterium]|nr:efflux RND transporter periplasmic adaptor subunit [Candidatus Omnitrophota bacterium]MCM8827738.1 efflux RND transporter periplasmic adaptor subunit [Candidatus Omnitrophota bacterium]
MKKLLAIVFKILKNRILILLIVLIVGGSLFYSHQQEKKKLKQYVTTNVAKKDLVISVIEGGNLKALKSQKIINEVPGSRNILEVVPEGTQITEEDVKNGKILLKLDSKDIENDLDQQKVNLETSYASFKEAEENLEIQKKQNESDINQAQLKVKFAMMDLEKYLGDEIAKSVLASRRSAIDYQQILKNPALGGDALNKKRQYENKIDLAKEELARSQDTVDWSTKLAGKGYVTKSELEADKLAFQQKNVSLEQAKLDYQLFINYDFPRQIEQLLSNYLEAVADLDRVKSKCQSRLIQAEANVKSKKATYNLTKVRLETTLRNLEKCTIKATQPGFVVYATTGRWFVESPIQPGTSVRQYQELLNLPDFSTMGVEVKIHESSVEKIKPGLPVKIKVDAFPDRIFTGKVQNIALMPDPTMKWLNPDLNVYVCQISLDKSYDYLRPGMSAQVEITVKVLKNVLVIPIVSVNFKEGKAYVNVLKGKNIETRQIVIGESSESEVEVKTGLNEGEVILISALAKTTETKKQKETKTQESVKPASSESQQGISSQSQPKPEQKPQETEKPSKINRKQEPSEQTSESVRPSRKQPRAATNGSE